MPARTALAIVTRLFEKVADNRWVPVAREAETRKLGGERNGVGERRVQKASKMKLGVLSCNYRKARLW